MSRKSFSLILEDGSIFSGTAPSWQEGFFTGEVVFSTGMTGYIETLTDPSYHGQILTFTYPLIGNYGVPPAAGWESKKIHASGVVITEDCTHWSHHKSLYSLEEWLSAEKIPLLTGIDTRALTKILRTQGTMRGVLTDTPEQFKGFPELCSLHSVAQVSPQEVEVHNPGHPIVIVVDCGMKEGIWRSLQNQRYTLKRVPYDYDYSDEEYAGVLISNGPGDPTACESTIAILRRAMRKKTPIFGICLGTQLMALAAGAKTYKLRYGHRGHNQPCVDTTSGRCYITSQNHGYAIDEASLSAEWEVAYRNLNDRSVEGIRHRSKPFFSVQFHPEASPGPTDTFGLFQEFFHKLSAATSIG